MASPADAPEALEVVQSQAVLELAVVSVSSQHAGEAAVSFAGDVAAGQPHLDGQEMAVMSAAGLPSAALVSWIPRRPRPKRPRGAWLEASSRPRSHGVAGVRAADLRSAPFSEPNGCVVSA